MPYNFKGLTGMGQSQSRGKKSSLNFAKCNQKPARFDRRVTCRVSSQCLSWSIASFWTSAITECSMSDERWPYLAAIASIILAISVAYVVERKCQRELAFQRSFPSALSELIVGSEPIRCWFSN